MEVIRDLRRKGSPTFRDLETWLTAAIPQRVLARMIWPQDWAEPGRPERARRGSRPERAPQLPVFTIQIPDATPSAPAAWTTVTDSPRAPQAMSTPKTGERNTKALTRVAA